MPTIGTNALLSLTAGITATGTAAIVGLVSMETGRTVLPKVRGIFVVLTVQVVSVKHFVKLQFCLVVLKTDLTQFPWIVIMRYHFCKLDVNKIELLIFDQRHSNIFLALNNNDERHQLNRS